MMATRSHDPDQGSVSSSKPKPYFCLLSLFPVTRAEAKQEQQKQASTSSSTACREDNDDFSLALTLAPMRSGSASSNIKKRKTAVPDNLKSTNIKKRKTVLNNNPKNIPNPSPPWNWKRQVNLVNVDADDHWEIKKRLTTSDLGNLCRLLVPKKGVESYILPHWDEEVVKKAKSTGLGVYVRDCDRKVTHELVFKYLKSSESYVFNDGWRTKFVVERKLKVNYEIGLYWHRESSMFMFSVLDPVVKLSL